MAMRPTPTSRDPLAPQPMTPDEIASMLARVRVAMRAAQERSVEASLAASGSSRKTAYARAEKAAARVLSGQSQTAARRMFHVSPGLLLKTLRRLAPWWFERPTPARCAARLVQLSGCSQTEAAETFGVWQTAVSQRLAQILKETK